MKNNLKIYSLLILTIVSFNLYNTLFNGHTHKIGNKYVFHAHPFVPSKSDSAPKHAHSPEEIFLYDSLMHPDIIEDSKAYTISIDQTGTFEWIAFDQSIKLNSFASVNSRSPPSNNI